MIIYVNHELCILNSMKRVNCQIKDFYNTIFCLQKEVNMLLTMIIKVRFLDLILTWLTKGSQNSFSKYRLAEMIILLLKLNIFDIAIFTKKIMIGNFMAFHGQFKGFPIIYEHFKIIRRTKNSKCANIILIFRFPIQKGTMAICKHY